VGAAGVVLTGGASRRMGRDKATLRVDGSAMASRLAGRLYEAGCTPVLCVGGDLDGLRALGLDARADRWPGEGPLGGVLTALELVGEATVLIVACDLIDLDVATMSAILDAPEADVAVAHSGRREPMCGRWSASVHAGLLAAFERGERSMQGGLTAVEAGGGSVVDVRVVAASMRNVNRPDDLAG
jgi:molybdenum cofactor guanylyltransferase